MRFQRRYPKSSIKGMPSSIDITGHTERTHLQCDASQDSDFVVEKRDLSSSPVRADVSLVRPNPQSPSRQTRKEKRKEIRSRLSNIATLENDSQDSRTPSLLTFHTFWTSQFFLTVYGIVLISLISRQLLLLHGVSLLILWRIMDRVLVWGLYLWRSNETKAIVQHVRWISKFAFKQAGKAAEGDRLRSYIATQAFKFWTGTGKNILKTMFRWQTSWVRNRALKETGDTLQQQMNAKMRSLQKTFSVSR